MVPVIHVNLLKIQILKLPNYHILHIFKDLILFDFLSSVVEGKQLKFKPGSSGKSYVQVSVVPSDDSMLRYTTKMAYNTTNPHYDETFKQ